MNFDLSDDQVALRAGIRALCEGRFPMKRVRAGFDRAVWQELAEAGVFSLRADGFGVTDAAIVFEELGRALVPGPLVWGLLANGHVDGLVGGIEPERDGPLLVEHLEQLDTLLVLDGRGVGALPASTLHGTPVVRPLDPLTPVHRVDDLRRGDRGGEWGVGRGPELVGEWRRDGAVLTAAYLVGMASACADLSVAYAKERQQFDRPIGSFQAVKHMLADMAVRTEVARAAVHASACECDDTSGVAPGETAVRAVAGAKLLAGEAAIANGRAATQVHGGMGFTWEVDVHLYLKRAWVLDTAFGSRDQHATALADYLTVTSG